MSIFKSSRNTTNFTQFNTSDDELLQHFNSFNWKLKFILQQSKVQIRNTGLSIFFQAIHLYTSISFFFVEKNPNFPNNQSAGPDVSIRSERAAECFLPVPLARTYCSRMGPSTLGTAMLGFLAVIVSHLEKQKMGEG